MEVRRQLFMIYSTDVRESLRSQCSKRLFSSDGSVLSGITIKFALAAEPHGDVNVDQRQATDAVNRDTEVFGMLGPTPESSAF